ncbi:MAG: hypothetical protein PHY34_02030 [Patescibacteria group bacterium]|nr:hypothetical protein [Patescibacteria group bacterium]MDD5715287.1 hypothetical protein [Patescibacteria group bacterium]
MLTTLLYIGLLCVILLVFGTAAYAGFRASPWLPVFKKDIQRIVTLAGINERDVVYDLGSGDGRILIALANNTKARLVVGYEISFLLYFWSKVRVWFRGFSKRIEVRYGDFLNRDLGQADVLFCFLTPKAMKKLGLKFQHELHPGTTVISYSFPIPGWHAVAKDHPDERHIPIYKYIIDESMQSVTIEKH